MKMNISTPLKLKIKLLFKTQIWGPQLRRHSNGKKLADTGAIYCIRYCCYYSGAVIDSLLPMLNRPVSPDHLYAELETNSGPGKTTYGSWIIGIWIIGQLSINFFQWNYIWYTSIMRKLGKSLSWKERQRDGNFKKLQRNVQESRSRSHGEEM